jgi:integrase
LPNASLSVCWEGTGKGGAEGINPKIASERLGHSKIGITLDLYSHIMPGMQEDAVAKVDAALQNARRRTK